jgi:hypothetical protein
LQIGSSKGAWLLTARSAVSPYRRIAVSPYRRIAVSPYRRIAVSRLIIAQDRTCCQFFGRRAGLRMTWEEDLDAMRIDK